MLQHFVTTNYFGVIAAAIEANVDCVDQVSHLIVLISLRD